MAGLSMGGLTSILVALRNQSIWRVMTYDSCLTYAAQQSVSIAVRQSVSIAVRQWTFPYPEKPLPKQLGQTVAVLRSY